VSDIAACLNLANQFGARTVTPAGQPSGHVYLIRTELLQSGMSLNDSRLATAEIPENRCVDVDYPDDLERARNELQRINVGG
jgi:hypothetical protein